MDGCQRRSIFGTGKVAIGTTAFSPGRQSGESKQIRQKPRQGRQRPVFDFEQKGTEETEN